MSTKKFDIRSALRSHLTTLSDLPDVAWENQVYQSIEGTTFLRETMIPADEMMQANNERMALGIYQVDVFSPYGGSIKKAEDLADEIKDHFHPGQVIAHPSQNGRVSIDKAAILQGNSEPPWYHIVIRINYRAHTINAVLNP